MTLFKSVKELLKLSIPIIIGQLGQMLIVAGDVFMASLYSTKSVAAIGVASGFLNPVLYFGVGLTLGISPVLAMKRGEGGHEEEHNSFSSIIYGLAIGFSMTFIMLGINKIIPYVGIQEELIDSILKYNQIIAWSFPFAIVFQAIKEYLQGFEKVIFANSVAILSVLLNLGLNYFFIFGFGEFKGFGEIGLAYASMGVRVFMALILMLYVFKVTPLGKLSLDFIKDNFKFSLPIAFMFFLEVLAFCTVSILSGKLNVVSAATNNIVMTIASVTFMIPLSLASATSVKVGHAFGSKNIEDVKTWIKSSLVCVGIFIAFSFSSFMIFPDLVMKILTNDSNVIDLGVKILFIVAIFQLSDGFQVVLSGILRGLNETRIPSFFVFIGYWIIGIPTGIYLSFYLGVGVQGLWIGLALALTLVAFSLHFVLGQQLKKLLPLLK